MTVTPLFLITVIALLVIYKQRATGLTLGDLSALCQIYIYVFLDSFSYTIFFIADGLLLYKT